jgi:hypothetical protein
MKTQSKTTRKSETRNRYNQLLGVYILFISAITVTYSIVTAAQVL